MPSRRLVLVGGGHAHLHVLRALARRPLPDTQVVLVTPGDHFYSAMVPGFLQGQYAAEDLRIDVHALASRAGVQLVRARADRVDAARRVVIASGVEIPFDLCSLDVGCEPAGGTTPGVTRWALTLRPMERALELRTRVDALIAAAAGRPPAVVVVGGGAGGVEVALAIRHRFLSARVEGSVSLVERGVEVLPEYDTTMRQLASRVLGDRGVAVALGGRVTAVSATAVTLHNGASLPADLVVWLAGAAAPRLVAESGLAHDADGFLLVDRSLRAVDGAPVWGAGDCITLRDFPHVAKAGVYAVREAPALERSLRAALGHGRPSRYRPQRSYLSLLNTGRGSALMRWKGIHRHSRWAWRLKDLIDRRFVRRFQVGDETIVAKS